VLENQLFAPALKGVIDFLRTLQGKGQTKKINKDILLITDTHFKLFKNQVHYKSVNLDEDIK
jgi:hypothetical protein